jgi:hypothetical protein
MNLDKLLALFTSFERNGVEYAVAGDLADLVRGRATLTERLEIVVADIECARPVIAEIWPKAELVDWYGPSELRVLPPDTPFYIDIVTQPIGTSELFEVRGVNVRVAAADQRSISRDFWSRPGFTLRERLAALHGLTRELVPPHVLSGVRKYRSIEQENAERERWDNERADRLCAERLRK